MGFKWTERVYKAFGPASDVDKEEMSILVAIAHCTNDVTNAGFPSTATLGRMTHISRSTIFNRLNALESKGYLSYIPGGFRDGRQYANEYVIKFPADPSQSVARTPSVRGADPSGLYDGRGVVSATDPNETIKYKSKENSLRGSSPSGAFQLDGVEFESLKSKILISNNPNGRGGVRKLPMAFTEKGLYMLATILKSKVAAEATIEIIETFALVRQLKRDVLVLHSEKDKLKQKSVIKRFGEALVDIVMPNEASTETESSIELNFVVAKLKHTVRKIRRANG